MANSVYLDKTTIDIRALGPGLQSFLQVKVTLFYIKVRLSYSISVLRQRLLIISFISIGSLAASGGLMMALVRMG